MNNKKALDVVVVGFALFSMFFGAGNLLFPPYLGLVSGTNWIYTNRYNPSACSSNGSC